MTTQINCRACRGLRPVAQGCCLGCGMPVANAEVKLRKRVRKDRRCPKCGSHSYEAMGDDRFNCRHCSAVYEDADFDFVDTRPVVNAIKKELRRA